jgi:hypothetical protein
MSEMLLIQCGVAITYRLESLEIRNEQTPQSPLPAANEKQTQRVSARIADDNSRRREATASRT